MNAPNHPVVFLADAHLRGRSDPNQQALVGFLRRDPLPGGLVILGDLFDFLAGKNRAAAEAYRAVLDALMPWAPVHFLEGNHDFDLEESVFGTGTVVIHTAPVTLELGGLRLRLFHGDRTSPTDLGTRLLRRILQSTPIRLARDRLLSDALVFRLALAFATVSRRNTWPGRANETQAAFAEARRQLEEHKTDAVIFAHTHQPLLQEVPGGLIANPGPAVVSGTYLRLLDRTLSLHRFPDGKPTPPFRRRIPARR
jgi:UDP-2,3-diacylglucosamine pyrophosphatase LpxH